MPSVSLKEKVPPMPLCLKQGGWGHQLRSVPQQTLPEPRFLPGQLRYGLERQWGETNRLLKPLSDISEDGVSIPGLQTQSLSGAGGRLEPPRTLQMLLRAAKPGVPGIRWCEAAGTAKKSPIMILFVQDI